MVPWAIIPAAGKGTRLLPATAVVPKVMLPVGRRPMLDWTLREAVDAGAQALIVVLSPSQPLVTEYIDAALGDKGAGELAELGQRLRDVEVHFVEQPVPAGLGDALVCCRRLTGDDAFAVLVPDNWFDAEEPAIAQVAKTHAATGLNTIGLTDVNATDARLLGNVGGVEVEALGGSSFRIGRLQDKLSGSFDPGESAATLRGCARYVVDGRFYDALEATGPPEDGEWDDVLAFQQLISTVGLAGHRIAGRLFDVGQAAGYMAAAEYLARTENAIGSAASPRSRSPGS